MSVSRLAAEELIIEPIRARLLEDQNFLGALRALEKEPPKNQAAENSSLVSCVVGSARRDPIWGMPSPSAAGLAFPPEGRMVGIAEGDRSPSQADALLASKLAAIESAAAVGAFTQREARARCEALRAKHERSSRSHVTTDAASLQANVERLRAALVSAATMPCVMRYGVRWAWCIAGQRSRGRVATCTPRSRVATCRSSSGWRSAIWLVSQVYLRW